MPERLPFNRWMKQLRAALDLTQEALAEIVGCAPQTIRSYESGRRRPSRELAVRIAAALQVPPADRARFVDAARIVGVDAAPLRQDPAPFDGSEAKESTTTVAAPPSSSPILTTKLYQPRPRAGLVSRPRLLARLTTGVVGRLTIITAPAGSGKTSLLADWLSRQEDATGAAWLALDPTDAEPSRFLRYLIAALQALDVRVAVDVLPLLQMAHGPRIDAVLPLLVNDLTLLPERSILVLDDYHVIDTPAVHQTLQFVIEHLPPQLHLVIASRVDPPLLLSRLRAGGELTELRAQDLRFTAEEAATFLRDTMHLTLSAEDVAALETRTEGWIAGLQMAALSLQHRPSEQTTAFIDAFAGSHRFVVDYLMEEVLARQPAHVQTFLLQTSILDRLGGPLCDAVVLGDEHSSEEAYSQLLIDQIERNNLFIIPLGDDRRWYRYHHLFADVMRSKLRATTTASHVNTLLLRAARWHERQGMVGDAIRYALAAGQSAEAGRMVEQHAMAMMEQNAYGELRRWLDQLPYEVIAARTRLCLAQASVQIEVDPTRVEPLLERAAALMDVAGRSVDTDEQQSRASNDVGWLDDVPAITATIRAILAGRTQEYERAIELLEQVIPIDSATPSYNDRMAMLQLGVVNLLRGSLSDAEARLRALLEMDRRAGIMTAMTVEAVARLGQILIMRGQLREVVALYERMLTQLEGQPRVPPLSLIHLGLGDIYYEWNNLPQADEQFHDALELGERFASIEGLIGIYVGRARILLARGDRETAQAAARKAQELLEILGVHSHSPRQLPLGKTLLALGDMALVQQWIERHDMWSAQDPRSGTEQEQMLLARVLLRQRKWPVADALMNRLLVDAEAGGRVNTVIEVLILQTLAHLGQKQHAEALATMERALTRAAPEGYVRLFVDEGAAIADLLAVALDQGKWGKTEQAQEHDLRGYTLQLVAAFKAEGFLASNDPHEKPVDRRVVHGVDTLTERELQVLQLLALGHSNQAIAQQLIVAVGTVKRHVNSILSKLAVQSRLQAVARARELNLI